MKINTVIKNLMATKGITQVDMTSRLKVAQSSVSGALSRDMKMSNVLRFLNELDCEVIIRDNTTGEEYQITE